MSKKTARLDCGGERKVSKAVCIKKPDSIYSISWTVMKIYKYVKEGIRLGEGYWVETNSRTSNTWRFSKEEFEVFFRKI